MPLGSREGRELKGTEWRLVEMSVTGDGEFGRRGRNPAVVAANLGDDVAFPVQRRKKAREGERAAQPPLGFYLYIIFCTVGMSCDRFL